MTEAGWAALQQRLLARYDDFKRRLTRYLGSSELAGDALHDTWLRLQRGGELDPVRSPDTYLLRIAINMGRDKLRADNRLVSTSDAATLLGIADDAPDAERDAQARSELRLLTAIMAELPPRQKAILIAARVEGLSRGDIARRFGVSVRYVHRELQVAHEYCAERFEEMATNLYRNAPRETSVLKRSPSQVDGNPKTWTAGDE